MAVVQGVGYPNPNRSHFESMDIWQSADPSRKISDGWLGRSLSYIKAPEGRMPAIHVCATRIAAGASRLAHHRADNPSQQAA